MILIGWVVYGQTVDCCWCCSSGDLGILGVWLVLLRCYLVVCWLWWCVGGGCWICIPCCSFLLQTELLIYLTLSVFVCSTFVGYICCSICTIFLQTIEQTELDDSILLWIPIDLIWRWWWCWLLYLSIVVILVNVVVVLTILVGRRWWWHIQAILFVYCSDILRLGILFPTTVHLNWFILFHWYLLFVDCDPRCCCLTLLFLSGTVHLTNYIPSLFMPLLMLTFGDSVIRIVVGIPFPLFVVVVELPVCCSLFTFLPHSSSWLRSICWTPRTVTFGPYRFWLFSLVVVPRLDVTLLHDFFVELRWCV